MGKMFKSFLLTTAMLVVTAPANATNLVLACGGYTKKGVPPKVAIYDISTSPATEKWSATSAGSNDIYDACSIVNHGTQVLVSAYYHAYLFNMIDGSISKTYKTLYSHMVLPVSNKEMLSSVSRQGKITGGIQILDYKRPNIVLTDKRDSLPWTHEFLKIKGNRNKFYVGYEYGIGVIKIPSLRSSTPDIKIEETYTAPTKLVHAMIYNKDGNILLSTNNDVYTFDIKNKTYTPFFSTVKRHVKTLSLNTDNGEYLYNTEDDDTVSGAGQPKLVHFTPATNGKQRADVTLPQAAYSVKWVYQDSNGVYSTKD